MYFFKWILNLSFSLATKLSVLEQSDRSTISKDKTASKVTATARDIDELKGTFFLS